jgi:hypothetical protein
MRVKKYAWFPKIVHTWRRNGSRAVIWLQSYIADENGSRHIDHLGLFSYEFQGSIFGNWFR